MAFRTLTRRPGFAAAAIFILALGIGANTAMFSMVDAVLLKPLPYPNPDRLVTVMEASAAKNQKESLIAPARLVDWNRMNRTFEIIAGSNFDSVTDTSGAEPERLEGPRCFTALFRSLRRQAFARAYVHCGRRSGGGTDGGSYQSRVLEKAFS